MDKSCVIIRRLMVKSEEGNYISQMTKKYILNQKKAVRKGELMLKYNKSAEYIM
jgi:hypothetical protein